MGYKIITENEGRGVVVEWSGIASAKEISAVNDEIYSLGPAAKLRYQIWDFTKAVKAVKPQVTPEDARLFAMQDGRAASKTPGMLIVLVGSKEYFNGMQTLYGVYADVWADNVKWKAFEGLKEARDWVASKCPQSQG